MVTPLIKVQDVLTRIGMEGSSSNYDDMITALILTATTQLEQFTRRTFTQDEHTEYFATKRNGTLSLDLTGEDRDGYVEGVVPQRIKLKALPVDLTEDFAVYYDVARLWPASTLVDASYYTVIPEAATLILECATAQNMRALKVVYTGGYAAAGSPETLSDAAPEDLKMACMMQTLFLYDKLSSGSISTKRQLEDGGAEYVQRDGVLSHEAAALAAPYRILGMRG